MGDGDATGRSESLPKMALAVWLAIAALLIYLSWPNISARSGWDPDDQLRLVQLRDFLAGQSWFDTTQYRLNAPEGGPMHWSRLIELPLALIVLLATPLLGQAGAEMLAGTLVPLACFGLVAYMLGRIAVRLGGPMAGTIAVIMTMVSPAVSMQLRPMRIDHHGWQLLLSVAMAWIALRSPSLANGLAAAAVITLHAEISLEALPYLAIFGGLFACEWLRDAQTGRRLLGFASGLIGFPAVWLLAMRGPTSTLTVYCDAFSLPYGAAVAAGGLVLAASLLGPTRLLRSPLRRLLALTIAALAGGLVFVLTGQECLGGPFGALDPLVRQHWYEWVSEGRPIWSHANTYGVVYIVPTLIGLGALTFAWRRSRNGPFAENWTRLAVIAVGSAVASAFVTRMGATTHAFLLPGFAVMALALWRWSRTRSSSLGRVGSALLVLTALPAVDAAIAIQVARTLVGQSAPTKAEASDCPSAVSAAALADEPRAHLFAPIDIGPALLVRTPHSVVATGHHRNEKAMRRVISAFLAKPAVAEQVVRTEGADFLVLCRGFYEVQRFAAAAPDGLAARLAQRKPVPWLRHDPRLSSESLSVYRILPPTGRSATN